MRPAQLPGRMAAPMTRARPRREPPCPHQKARTVETCEACDSADEAERLRELLRAVQFRGDGFSCIGRNCGQAHRWGCKPGCEVGAAVTVAETVLAPSTNASRPQTRTRPTGRGTSPRRARSGRP